MSGRTFGLQSSWNEALRILTRGLDVDQTDLRRSVDVADSINQQMEEFVNRYCVTANNDNGDLTFDAAGTYIFNGGVGINGSMTVAGDVTLDGSGVFKSSDTGQRIEMGDETTVYDSETYRRIRFFSGDADEATDGEAWIGIGSNGTGSQIPLLLLGPKWSDGTYRASIYLQGNDGVNDSSIEASGTYASFLGYTSAVVGLDDLNTDIQFGASGIQIGASGGPNVYLGNSSLHFGEHPSTTYLGHSSNVYSFVIGGTEQARISSNGDLYAARNVTAISGRFYAGGSLGTQSNDYLQHVEDSNYWRFVIDGTEHLRIGPGIGGSYGTTQTAGTGKGSYEGYNINGHFAMMSNSSTTFGLYNDANNQWLILYSTNTYGRIYDSDTTSSRVAVGFNDWSSGTGASANGYVAISDGCGGFTGTACHLTTTTVAGQTMKRLGFLSSSMEFKWGAEKLEFSDEAFLGLKPITFHPNDTYVLEDGTQSVIPDKEEAAGMMPLRRAGFGWEDLMSNDETMLLATDFSYDYGAMLSVVTLKLQQAMRDIEDLKKNKKMVS